MKAENIQVGGNHYKTMAYQTARFGYDVELTSLGTQIAKYLTRDKGSRNENLEKAYHCICLDQQFENEDAHLKNFESLLNIYYKDTDEHFLEKYFSQFPDGGKLKAIMRQYMKANFSQAKGLLRKYINSIITTNSEIKRKDGRPFVTGWSTARVRYFTKDGDVVTTTGECVCIEDLENV